MNMNDDFSITFYQKSIPGHCRLRTYYEHTEIGMCWGLLHHIKINKGALVDKTNCGICEFSVLPADAEQLIEWRKGIAFKRLVNDIKESTPV